MGVRGYGGAIEYMGGAIDHTSKIREFLSILSVLE